MDRRKYLFRYLLLTLIFSIVCVVYLGKLFYVQLASKGMAGDDGTTVRTVTVQAMRGEIYDRNGKKLVSNAYLYDLTLSYPAVSHLSIYTANNTYLQLFRALDACGETDTHKESYFPFSGSYPYYSMTAEASDPDSVANYRLKRILRERSLEEDLEPHKIVKYYVDTYQLLARDSTGTRLYNDDEVDRLFRLHYDMDAVRFGPYGDYTFATNVSMTLMTYIRELNNVNCVSFTVTAKRVYEYPGVASHILGTVGPIWAEEWDYYNEQGYQMNAMVGKSGCELAFEPYLRGIDGKMKITENAVGEIVNVEVVTEPVAGHDVFLTVDIDLQIAAEEGLAETVDYVQNYGEGRSSSLPCDAGAAVVMDPGTFEVLAVASYPSFDLTTYNRDYNRLVANPANPLLNRALQGTYAPGSTFKPGIAIAGLTEGKIDAYTAFFCDGSYSNENIPGDHPGCSTYTSHSGSYISVREAISDSCNSFFYELGYRLGIEKMDEYMKNFGFGEPTGIELGEKTGILAGPDYRHASYRLGEVIRVAIGQSDTQATPLQICGYLSTLYNGGARYSVHLLDRVCAFGSGAVVWTDESLSAEPLSRVNFSQNDYNTVLGGMRDMVRDTAFARNRLSGLGLDDVAGKTGTAQRLFTVTATDPESGEAMLDANGNFVTESVMGTNALFICAAEYRGQKLTTSVVIEKAAHGYYNAIATQKILTAWKAGIDERNS